MNRQLKFRVWDKKRNNFLHNLEQMWDLVIVDGELSFFGGDRLDENFVVQQFTGLSDKDDKDIYEGDIISHGFENHICEIKWEDYRLVMKDYNMGRRFDLYCMMKNTKVIGNIFESKDLLPVTLK